MGASEQLRQHRYRCGPHLARLRMLARDLPGALTNDRVVHETSRAANAIMAEANAGYRTVLARAAGGPRPSGSQFLLRSRLARLQAAADDTVAAASQGDAVALLRRVHRFESLTSAIWAVLLSAVASPRSRATASRPAATPGAQPPTRFVTALPLQ